jgi:RHS repeat-associated protein
MGQGAPLNSARSIAALYVSSDLMNGQALNGQTNLENYVVEAIVNRWFTDQVTSNIVTVQQGWNSEEFVLMPNGSYSSPVGSASILDVNGGNLRYRTKSGVTMTFNGNPTATSGPVYIASLTTAGGASVNFSYAGGNLIGVSNSATGHSLSINYSGSQISSVWDGTGRSVSYTISGGNLTQFTDAQQNSTTYSYDTSGAYDTAGHLTQIFYPSNPTNAFLTNYYDGLGHVWKQQDANKNTSQVFASGSRMEIDDAAGNRHVYINDPLGNVLEEIQDYGNASHLNATTVNVYNAQSLLVSKTMPEGNSTTYTYDSLFNPTTITQYPKPGSGLSAVQQTITYIQPVSALPNFEAPYQVTDAKGNVTTYKYDSYGNVIEIDQPAVPKPGAPAAQPTSLFTYTSIGMMQTATDPEGRVTRYDYFSGNADQVQKMTVDYGRLNYITQYTYDNYGNVCMVTDPNGNVTTTVHDALGRVTEEDAPNALSITKYDYYPNGQVKDVYREQNTPSVSSPATCNTNSTETSPVWETTTYTYTPTNKVYQITDPLGNTTTTAYDGDDRVYTVTKPVSSSQYRVSVSTYDALSRPYQISVGTGASTSAAVASAAVQATSAYTLNGRQKSITDANNNLTGMTYDGFDRLSSTIYPDSTTEQFQYDANNNVTQKTTRSGQTISSSYDALNRVQTKTPQGEAAGTVTYGYDYSGRMLQASDGSNSTPSQIGYDTAGRANSFTDQLGQNTQVAHDGAGNQTEVVWPAGTSGTGSYSVNYKYDAMNRMQYVNEGGTNHLLAQYSWDALSRTQSIAYGDGTSDAYSQYDAGDNLRTLTQTYNGSNSSVTFNYTWLMNHQLNLAGVNNPLFQYLPQAGTVSYGTANADNELTTMTASLGSATMTYDGNHNLTYDGFNTLGYDVENRIVQAENGVWGTSTYLYDPLGHRKQKVVGVNTATSVATDFVLAGGQEIADYYETSATWRLTVRGAGGLPLVTVVPAAGGGSEEIVYVHHDVKGSTVALTVPGSSGAADTYTYSEYGQPQSGSWMAYEYAGYRYDSETGLYYMPARYYSPALGRFVQADPVGFRGGMNLYAYAGNDPVNLMDPMGLTPDGSYEQKYTITLSETIATPFMGLFGVPTLTVSASSTETSGICSCTTAGAGPSPQEIAEMAQLAAQSLILPLDVLDGNEAGAWRSAMLIISNQTLLAAQTGNSSMSLADAEEKAAMYNSISTPMGILTALFSQNANLGEGASLANAAYNAQNELDEMAESGGTTAGAVAMSAELYSLVIDEVQIGAHQLCPQ